MIKVIVLRTRKHTICPMCHGHFGKSLRAEVIYAVQGITRSGTLDSALLLTHVFLSP